MTEVELRPPQGHPGHSGDFAPTFAVIVSACLVGEPCRYDGESKRSKGVLEEIRRIRGLGGEVVTVCPEQLGGLGTPRPAAELRGGDGQDALAGRAAVRRVRDDADVTAAFVAGAHAAAARAPTATSAVLKARSPSCGCGTTHRDGAVAPGDGVFAALLRRRGLHLRTEEDLEPRAEQGAT